MASDLGSTSIEKISSALSFVMPDERADWVKVGMSIKAELGDAGFEFWDNWGRKSPSYNISASKSVWKSIKAGGKVTIASLFGMAKDKGWTWDRPDVKPTPEAIEKWCAESRAKAEAAEAETARVHALAAERARAVWAAAEPVDENHPYLIRKKVGAHGLRMGRWEVVDASTGEVRLITPKALLVPIKDRTGAIWSLQGIFPRKLMAGRDKDYLAGGAKVGHFHAIGKPQEHDGRKVFILAEGYATAASIHEPTGHLVLVCFDTSGLLSVAVSIRERQPDAIILLAADNDQFTKRKDGTPYNPGVEAASRAAEEVGGLVVVPQFVSLDGEPTDWNDLRCREGDAVVRDQVLAGIAQVNAPSGPDEAPLPWEGEPAFEKAPPPAVDDDPVVPQAELDEADHLLKNKYFTILGYDHEEYFLFVHGKQQVVSRTAARFNDLGFLELANDINWWEMNFPGHKGGMNHKAAASWIIAIAESRGIYDPGNIRGRGAWLDDGRSVFHLGDKLVVDGKEMTIDEISSAFVYPRGKKMPRPSAQPLSKAEGAHLLDVAKQVRWSMQGSALLLAGWAFLAPICGALKWRPHIWITGGAGSGKSTVQRDFCYALTRGVAKYGQGDSTEAGVRQKLASDALPVLIDEFETNDDKEKARVDGVIAMIRKSSSESEAETMKGTISGDGVSFKVRSMFCLASINTKLDKQADMDRITKLLIRVPPKDGSQIEHWKKLEADLYNISHDDSLPSRLMARSVSMVPTVLQAVKVFVKVASQRFSSQRMGDQYGTLIAGCWCLTNDHAPSEEEARDVVFGYNWDEHTEDQDQDDAKSALDAILNSKIRMANPAGDVTIDELIRESLSTHHEGLVDQKVAAATLKRHGIRVEEEKGVLLFGTNVPNLKALLKNTSCSTDVRGQLLRLNGAGRWQTERFSGASSKCVSLPLSAILDEAPAPSSPPDADDDYPI